MNVQTYQKKQNAAMDADFNSAAPYGKVRLGSEYLFWKKLLTWYFAPLSEVFTAYRRVEEVNSKTCCCSSDFSIHKLIIRDSENSTAEILIGDSLYRHEPELLLEALLRENPHIQLGAPTDDLLTTLN